MQKFSGIEYIYIDMANQFGLDKELWEDRITWSKDMLSSQAKVDAAIEAADEPMLLIKAIHAYNDATNGVATGFIMGLDATTSFLQIMACLSNCEKSAIASNLIFNGKRNDAYSLITNKMNVNVPRDRVKYGIMTSYYGSVAKPKEIFGEDTPELALFYKTLLEEFPGAEQVKATCQSCWMPDNEYHQWTLPDGHVARIRVGEYVEKKIEIPELTTHTGNNATFTHRAKVFQPAEYGISLIANIIHSLDGWLVRELRRRCKALGFDILAVHDQFWCSPNHMNELRQCYVDILIWVCEHKVLETILCEITGSKGTYKKFNGDVAGKLKTAEYALS